MSDLLKNIDARTKLAGTNKLEILMFTLGLDKRTNREETPAPAPAARAGVAGRGTIRPRPGFCTSGAPHDALRTHAGRFYAGAAWCSTRHLTPWRECYEAP